MNLVATRRRLLAAAVPLMLLSLGARAATRPLWILFIDTGNTGRSVAAEALAMEVIQKRRLPIVVRSRAVALDPADLRPEPHVVELLAARGLDVSLHRAEALTAADIADADLVLTMTAKHRAKVIDEFPGAAAKTFTLSTYATGKAGDVEDAKDQPLMVYQKMLDQVSRLVPLALSKALCHGR